MGFEASTGGSIADTVKRIVVDVLQLEPSQSIDPETNLFDLGADSITVVELFVAIEKHFGILFDEEELTTKVLERFEWLADFVAAKKKPTCVA